MAMKGFKFDPGLRLELFAAEPMLANGVAFSPDEKGRWYVAETYRQERGVEDNRGHGNWLDDDIAARTVEDRLAMIHKFYPDPKKFAEKFTKYADRVVRLEDSDGDGKADKSTVFADGFNDPLDGTGAGILARGNEVWWTCIPNLWRFRDDNGDGVADAKDKLLSGFGVKFAFRGHDMHGLRFGPDGKLYWSIGDRGLHVKTPGGRTVSEPDTGSILRANPDGSGLEIFASGVRNPQELAFDEHGNLFTGDNNSDGGDQARFTMLVEGGDCGWRMGFQYLSDRGPWNRERLWDAKEALKAKYLIPPIANIGNGPSGLTYNPGTGLSDKYRNRFFLSDFRGGASASVVHEIALEPRGAFFKLKERRDFVKGLLTTDVEFGPDGALYMLDWVESWSGVGKGRIYRFSDPAANAALQAETKKLIGDGMSKRPEPELAALLGHADMRVRMAAQFELAARGGDGPAAIFTKAAQSGPAPLARLHGIWGLTQLAAKGNPQVLAPLAPLLADGDAEVRAQAAKAFGELRVAPAGEKLMPLLKDGSTRVRFFAAMSLGKIGHGPAFEPLCQMLAENNDADPILRHGGVMGLAGVANAQQLTAKAADGSTAVRIGALLALRRKKSPEIARFLADADRGVMLEAARAIHDVPIDGAMNELAKLIARKGITDAPLLSRVVNANFRLGKAEHAQALTAFASDPGAPEPARQEALEVLADWARPGPRDRVLNMWRPLPDRSATDAVTAITPALPALLKDSPVAVQQAVAQLAGKLGITAAGDALFALVKNSGARSDARVAAMQALATLKDARLPDVARFAVAEQSAKVRSEGLKTLANVDPAAAVKAIGDIIQNASVAEKQAAVSALTRVKTPEANALLGALLDRIISGSGIAPEVQLDLLDAARQANAGELNAKIKQYEATLPAADLLAPFRIALVGGDAERGRKTFREKAEVQCLRCHKCEIGDSAVGPDLTRIGAQKDRAYLLESIVHPNAKIAEGFQTVVLTLKDASFVVGRLVKEDAATLQVETLDEQGKPKSVGVPVANIQNRTSAPSPMPENIRDFLSKSELRDLVEYLATRK